MVSIIDTQEGVYKKLVINEDRKFILGGMVVGDPDLYGQILPLVQNSVELKAAPERYRACQLPTARLWAWAPPTFPIPPTSVPATTSQG